MGSEVKDRLGHREDLGSRQQLAPRRHRYTVECRRLTGSRGQEQARALVGS